MRFLILFLLVSVIHLTRADNTYRKDSLLHLLSQTQDSPGKIKVYRNLADLCFETPEENVFLKKMYAEALKINDLDNQLSALQDLVQASIKNYQLDSAFHYMNLVQKSGDSEMVTDVYTYLQIRFLEREILDKNSQGMIEKELHASPNNEPDYLYARIKQNFVTGCYLAAQEKGEEAQPFLEEATTLSARLPFKNGYKYRTLCQWNLAHVYRFNGKGKEAVELIKQAIALLQTYYDTFYKNERPFFNINTRIIQNYSFILSSLDVLSPEEADDYLEQIQQYSRFSDNPWDKYNGFLATNNYYLYRKNYEKALQTNDSLIKYARLVVPYNLEGLYGISSQICEAMGNALQALHYLKLSYRLKDSLNTQKTQEKFNELQVKYNLDKLAYEKTQLEIANKRILLFCFAGLFFLVSGICFYLFYNLRKERQMKNKLHLLKERSEESEKMKTAFINSMCHEIRTPLNAILGFSDLLLDDEVDLEARKTFPGLIRQNGILLTSLIQDVLEVSNLDVSEEKLPCEPTDLTAICRQEIDRIKELGKPSIQYTLDIPEEKVIISTHAKYLSRVIEHLLSNANKFTQKGSIILSFRISPKGQTLFLSVTDTGCGIPPEKYELVFQRFSKLDTFTQGNGLGLYLCRLIVKRLNGEIQIDPTYTGGTRFLIRMPLK